MNKLKGLFFIALLFLFNPAYAESQNITISWQAPTRYDNGEKLFARADLKEYRLYYGPSLDQVRENSITVAPFQLSMDIPIKKLRALNSPIVYFVMSSVSKGGIESEQSKSIFFLP